MTERQLKVEEMLHRIDELLNVLNMISRDLTEISNELKVVSVPSAATAGRIRTVENIRVLFPSDLEDLLTFEETQNYIVIKTRRFLGSDNFARIASIVREAGGEYISSGKESHFRVPREID